MAQGVVIRFKADSNEYDARLKRSIEHMKQMENEANKLNGTVDRADKSYIKFVQSLGSMETKANSAKGKINEMTQAFVELSVQYNKLTKEEKSGAYGKALASSLDQLKSRIKGAKSELAGIEGQLTGIGDVFKQVGSKMGIPMEMFTKLGPLVAAAGAAIKVATDVFRQNEELMDEWGRTTEAAGTVYQGFLNALNTGDIGGFLRNIGKIISKSREAYDAMDQLGTFNAFNQIQIEGARTNFTEAMANYREGSGTKEDVKAAADRLKNEMQSRQNKEQAAYIAAIKELAASRGVDEEMLQKALSGTYGDYETLKNTPLTRHEEQIWNGNMFGKTTTTKVAWSADTMEQKLGEALRKLSDDELARIQSLGAQAQRTATEIAQVDKQVTRVLGAGNKGGKTQVPVEPVIPEGSAAALRKQIADLQKQWDLATTQDERNSLKGQIDAANEALKAMVPQVEAVATVIHDAAFMWNEHTAKIGDVKARLAEFQAMMGDTSLSSDQRDWAARMAESYQKQLDKMQGATEEAVDKINDKLQEIPSTFEMFKDSVGAIGSLVGAMDNLKSIGEDLAAVFSGDMDAWDALMTIFNSGIGIMQTVIGVMEAINTLTELSSALKLKNAAASTTEAVATTASTAATTSQAAADTAAAAAAGSAAAANAAEGATAAGKAVAWIPIAGPILAAAAIAAVIVSMVAAMSKAKSAGNFAMGGKIPGNSFSGDNMRGMLPNGDLVGLDAGEIILNRAQQGVVAGAMQGNPMNDLNLGLEVEGTKMLILLNNTNRSLGGSRNFYSERH